VKENNGHLKTEQYMQDEIEIGAYRAMDKDGYWSNYLSRPIRLHKIWMGEYIEKSRQNTTKEHYDWRESLCLMTENGLVKV